MVAILFGSLAFCLILTVPIGIALAISSAAVILTGYDTVMLNLLSQAMVTSIDNYALMAIPFFMMLGILMEKVGIAQKIIAVGEAFVGDMPGGLGGAAIVACMFFAAISGSGPACVAAIGSIMIPAMSNNGYNPAYSGALLAAGSTVGPVIPPSIPMIVYGATVGVSVSKLFMAGVIPGLLMGISMLILNYFISKKRGYIGKPRGGGFGWICKQVINAFWALLMPIIVLGGIYAGIFTPTESAVVGVFYALFVGALVYRQVTADKLIQALMESATLAASVLLVMGGASTFGRLLTLENVPQLLTEFMLTVSDNGIVIMLMINLGLLVAGMFIDTISNIILFAPLFVPIVKNLGYDLTYFGLLMCVNLCIGFLTPPLGGNLFVAQNVSRASFESIVKEVLPLIAVLVVALVFLICFPQLSLFLPELFGM